MSNLNMKSSLLLVMVLCIVSVYSGDSRRGGKPSATQGPDLFVKGKYLEFAVNPSGGFGSRAQLPGRAYGGSAVPSGMHKSGDKTRLGITVDYDLNGWNVGTPPQSGDVFLEGYSDVGWHLTWEGPTGLQEFDQSPMQNDEDDGDDSFAPPRGCIKCVNGQRADGCDETEEDCSCNLDIINANFIDCPFKRWDLDTISITRTQDSDNMTTITFIGIANAREFYNSTSGRLIETGEKIKVTKVMTHKYTETYVTEHTTLENVGTVDLHNVALVFHVVPTQEAFPNANWPKNPETDFANWISIPNQNTAGKTLVKARGQNYNITTSLGSNDQDAIAWYAAAKDWRATNGYQNLARQMWISDPKSAFVNEFLAEVAIALGFKVNSFPVGQVVTKTHFWAFTSSAIDAAQAHIDIAYTSGISTGITSGLTTGDLSTGDLSTGDISTGVTSGITSADLSTGDITTTVPSTTGDGSATTGDVAGSATTGDVAGSATTGDVAGSATTGDVAGSATTGDVAGSATTGDVAGSATTGDVAGSATTGDVAGSATTGDVAGSATTGDVAGSATTGTVASGSEATTGVAAGSATTGVAGSGATTGHDDGGVVTTGEDEFTTGEDEVTTGEDIPITTGPLPATTSGSGSQSTTGEFGQVDVTTGVTSGVSITNGITTATGNNFNSTTETNPILSTGEDQATKDRNVKIIASVFGVAGFILLVLCIGGIILAVRRMQKDPVV